VCTEGNNTFGAPFENLLYSSKRLLVPLMLPRHAFLSFIHLELRLLCARKATIHWGLPLKIFCTVVVAKGKAKIRAIITRCMRFVRLTRPLVRKDEWIYCFSEEQYTSVTGHRRNAWYLLALGSPANAFSTGHYSSSYSDTTQPSQTFPHWLPWASHSRHNHYTTPGLNTVFLASS
jgi:hypothetical protein